MMSHTNIDYLLQLTAPSSDRGPSAAHSGDDRPAFNDHLARAADKPLEPPSKAAVKLSASQPPRPEDHTRLGDAPPAAGSDESPPDDCTTGEEPEVTAGELQGESESTAELIEAADTGVTESDTTAASDDGKEGEDADKAADGLQTTAALPQEVQLVDIEAAPPVAASPDTTVTEHQVEVDPRPAAAEIQATTNQRGDAQSEPASAAAKLPAETETVAATETLDVGWNLAQKMKPTDKPLQVSIEAERPTEQGQTEGAAEVGNSDKPHRPTESEPAIADNRQLDRTRTATGEVAGAGVAGRAKPAKLTAPGRRAGEKAKAEESRRSTSSHAEVRSETTASANQAVAAAVANQAAVAPAVATAGTEAAEESASTSSKSAGRRGDSLLQPLVRGNRAHAAAGRASHAAADHMPRIDASRFVGRVAKAVQTAHERGGALQLRLSPPELGSLRLELNVQNGVMTATLETETSAARQVLLDHLPALRERLSEQNIRIERFDVDVRQEGSGGQADPRESQQQTRDRQPHEPPPRQASSRPRAAEGEQREPIRQTARQTTSGINLLA